MRQVVLANVGEIEYKDVPLVELRPGCVRIKILRCGVCGTDVHNYYLETIFGKDRYPFHIGHEICGIVDAISDDVKNVKVGDKVVMSPFWTCGACESCHLGHNNHCDSLDTIGLHGPSGYSEYTVAPATSIVKVPDDADINVMTFTEPVATIVYALDKIHLSPEHDVLIIGPGPIGLLFFQYLKKQAINSLTMAGRNKSKLDFAKSLGCKNIIDTSANAIDKKYDVIIDCTGNASIAQETVNMAKFGGQILIFGVCPIDSTITWSPFALYQKDLSVHMSFALNQRAFQRSVHLLESGYLDVLPLIADIRPVGRLEESIKELKAGKINGKIVIDSTRLN